MTKAEILHIGIRDRHMEVKEGWNGLIYNPNAMFFNPGKSLREHYNKFFRVGSQLTILPIVTERSPRQLTQMLSEDFEIDVYGVIGRNSALFRTNPTQALEIIESLKHNPERYMSLVKQVCTSS